MEKKRKNGCGHAWSPRRIEREIRKTNKVLACVCAQLGALRNEVSAVRRYIAPYSDSLDSIIDRLHDAAARMREIGKREGENLRSMYQDGLL